MRRFLNSLLLLFLLLILCGCDLLDNINHEEIDLLNIDLAKQTIKVVNIQATGEAKENNEVLNRNTYNFIASNDITYLSQENSTFSNEYVYLDDRQSVYQIINNSLVDLNTKFEYSNIDKFIIDNILMAYYNVNNIKYTNKTEKYLDRECDIYEYFDSSESICATLTLDHDTGVCLKIEPTEYGVDKYRNHDFIVTSISFDNTDLTKYRDYPIGTGYENVDIHTPLTTKFELNPINKIEKTARNMKINFEFIENSALTETITFNESYTLYEVNGKTIFYDNTNDQYYEIIDNKKYNYVNNEVIEKITLAKYTPTTYYLTFSPDYMTKGDDVTFLNRDCITLSYQSPEKDDYLTINFVIDKETSICLKYEEEYRSSISASLNHFYSYNALSVEFAEFDLSNYINMEIAIDWPIDFDTMHTVFKNVLFPIDTTIINYDKMQEPNSVVHNLTLNNATTESFNNLCSSLFENGASFNFDFHRSSFDELISSENDYLYFKAIKSIDVANCCKINIRYDKTNKMILMQFEDTIDSNLSSINNVQVDYAEIYQIITDNEITYETIKNTTIKKNSLYALVSSNNLLNVINDYLWDIEENQYYYIKDNYRYPNSKTYDTFVHFANQSTNNAILAWCDDNIKTETVFLERDAYEYNINSREKIGYDIKAIIDKELNIILYSEVTYTYPESITKSIFKVTSLNFDDSDLSTYIEYPINYGLPFPYADYNLTKSIDIPSSFEVINYETIIHERNYTFINITSDDFYNLSKQLFDAGAYYNDNNVHVEYNDLIEDEEDYKYFTAKIKNDDMYYFCRLTFRKNENGNELEFEIR